jgi:ATP-dependent Clp endopeptidase proteolytic subunit ClpP
VPWRSARNVTALTQGRSDWFKIKALSDGKPTQLHIYDEIGYVGITAQDLIKQLADIDGPLDVHLNSPGGEVFDGLAIYNSLLQRDDVSVYVDALAASITSVIAMAASPGKLFMARNSRLMIHNGFGMMIGTAGDMRYMADMLDGVSDDIAGVYSDRSGKPKAHWKDLMDKETWMTADEAVECGLADKVLSNRNADALRQAADWDLSIFNKAPKLEDAASVPYVGREESRHKPMTGTHTHDHSSHGHPDHDDGMHSHPHSHDNDASHNPSDGHRHGTTHANPDGDDDSDHDAYASSRLPKIHGESDKDPAGPETSDSINSDFNITAEEHAMILANLKGA